MFVDRVSIRVAAGKGGDGAVSFHREKYVAAGGPDGGDGGKGGDVVFVADDHLSTLLEFQYRKNYRAQDGQPGGGKRMTGKSGADLVIRVPRGTLVRESGSGRLVADISGDEPVVIARGGRGGKGNTHFATPTRQIPRFAKPGFAGEAMELVLELKLLADVGLVGFPNVGKSTLISVVSAAKPKIANYPFTTLTPVLGVVKVQEGKNFVMADIPGLIEGASQGLGLGHAFLRHVERCRLIVHVVDVSGSEGRDPVEDFERINHELRSFSPELADRPQLVAGNKCDLAQPEQVEKFSRYLQQQGMAFFAISAAARQGTGALVDAIAARLDTLPPIRIYQPDPVELPAAGDKGPGFTVTRQEDGTYLVEGSWLQRALGMVNVEDEESLQYLQRVLRQGGVIDALEAAGIQENDTVSILGFEFEYIR